MESGRRVLGERGAQGDPPLDGAQADADRPQPEVRATRLTARAAEAPCLTPCLTPCRHLDRHFDGHRGPGAAGPAADVRRACATRAVQPTMCSPRRDTVPASWHDGESMRARGGAEHTISKHFSVICSRFALLHSLWLRCASYRRAIDELAPVPGAGSMAAVATKPKAKLMVASDLGPQFSKIEKPDPTKGQTAGKRRERAAARDAGDVRGRRQVPRAGTLPAGDDGLLFVRLQGQQAASSTAAATWTQQLLDDLANNAPHLMLDVENRQLIDLEMLKIFEALGTNSTVTELKLATTLRPGLLDCATCSGPTAASPRWTSAATTSTTRASARWRCSRPTARSRSSTSPATSARRDQRHRRRPRRQPRPDQAQPRREPDRRRGARALQAALEHNKTLRELSGFNNVVVDKELRKWLKTARRA